MGGAVWRGRDHKSEEAVFYWPRNGESGNLGILTWKWDVE